MTEVSGILGPEQNKVFSLAPELDTSTVTRAVVAAPTIPAAKIDAFGVSELKLANADADCMSQNEVDLIRQVRAEYDKAFIAENRILLIKLRQVEGG